MLAIADELTEMGLVLRYRVDRTEDGLSGVEGTFSICSFWLVSALAEIGEHERASHLCEHLLNMGGALDLYAEEIEPRSGRQLGNFPQAFTHLALINAVSQVIADEVADGRDDPTSARCFSRDAVAARTPRATSTRSGGSDLRQPGRFGLFGLLDPLLVGRRRVAQVPLGVERAAGAGPGGGDRLPVGEVDEIADREDAGEVGPRRRLLDLDVAVVVQVDLAGDERRAGDVADRDERSADLDLGDLVGLGVAEPDPIEGAVVAGDELLRDERRLELDVGRLAGPVLHHHGGAEVVAAMEHGQLVGVLGDEDRILHRRVAAADRRPRRGP